MQRRSDDFTSVSPSARSLLLMKGYTDIPYAREAAELVQGPDVFELDAGNKDMWFWMRVMHMEARYRSIDQLLEHVAHKNVLELSSGFSFRGPDLCQREAIHYIDTDLGDMVDLKQQMMAQLHIGSAMMGRLEVLPLNVMDEEAFKAVVDRFAPGPVTIVNEGLLMYLDMEEKKRLCSTIRRVLEARGGCWITADVYIQRPTELRATMPQSRGEAAFFEQHRIEENKFVSYEDAAAFFNEQGMELVEEATTNYDKLSSLPHLVALLPQEIRDSKQPPPKIQATWMLRARNIAR